MEKTTTIVKHHIHDKIVYVKMKYNQNEHDLFALTIYEEDKSWSGKFTHEIAKKNRERVLETEEEYCDNVVKGLSKHPDFSVTFTLNPDDHNSATFSWKKKLGSAVLVHGSVLVHRDEVTESKDSLLDSLILENQELKDTLDSMNLKNKELSQDFEKCIKTLEKAAEIKESSEEALYCKFVQVLNAKKRRIQLLEENISKMS